MGHAESVQMCAPEECHCECSGGPNVALHATALASSLMQASVEVVGDGYHRLDESQMHVFHFDPELDADARKALEDHFTALDIDGLNDAFEPALRKIMHRELDDLRQPKQLAWLSSRAPSFPLGPVVTVAKQIGSQHLSRWASETFTSIQRGHLGVVLLAGGTERDERTMRPLCMWDVGLPSRKSVLQLCLERVLRLLHLATRAAVQTNAKTVWPIPVYVLCNDWNKEEIVSFLVQNRYFGMDDQEVLVSSQPNSPVLNENGRILLQEKGVMAMTPCGNGGLFQTLADHGILADLKCRNVSMVSVHACDNLLVRVADPMLLGHTLQVGAACGVKLVERLHPTEPVGVFCARRGHLLDIAQPKLRSDEMVDVATVVEHRELPDEIRSRRQRGDGPLWLQFANAGSYCFRTALLEKIPAHAGRQWHASWKRQPYVALNDGRLVEPHLNVLNAVRLETHLTDAFELVSISAGYCVSRGEEYAKLSLKPGFESPKLAAGVLARAHQQWISNAGGRFVGDIQAGNDKTDRCEVSPFVSYAGEDLLGHFSAAELALPLYVPARTEIVTFMTQDPGSMETSGDRGLRVYKVEAFAPSLGAGQRRSSKDQVDGAILVRAGTGDSFCMPPTPESVAKDVESARALIDEMRERFASTAEIPPKAGN
mmetsp:Transcript_33653/g.81431  ORF Transcript_33653/g.81431 Transcript_33653/m.81431 type:complete len:656 (-) Transcript_33653:79-2046(-)